MSCFRRCLLPVLFAAPFVVTGCPPSPAEIVVEPAAIDFGEVALDTTESVQLALTNEGGTAATIVLQLAGDGPFDVALTGAIEVLPDRQRLAFVDATPWAVGTTTDVLRVIWGDEVVSVPLSVTGVTAGVDDDEDGWTVPADCDDTDPDVHPEAPEVCDGVDNDCNAEVDDTIDEDADGVFACEDCDDADPWNFPGNEEECDAQDNDCDEAEDEGFDEDEDGFTTCAGDCNDQSAAISPSAAEVCNGLDEDCDTEIDETFLGPVDDVDQDGEPGCTDCDDDDPTAFHGNTETCDGIDNDCDSDVDENLADLDGDGFAGCVDCDDTNGAIHPDATEICDGVDNNCDTEIDEGFDLDIDGEATCEGDCDDDDPQVNSSAAEVCNGVDDDCADGIDEGFDVDADGARTCGADGILGTADDDCDDSDAGRFPGNAEICDGIDSDCDLAAEDVADLDADGVTACGGDCDDDDSDNFPGNLEVCDGQDNNCDGNIDDGAVDLDLDGVTDCSDCDDEDPDNFPGNAEVCDGQDNDCGSDTDEGFDVDGDTVTTCGVDGVELTADDDCDDADADVYPGAAEICTDGVDMDCDGSEPEPCESCLAVLGANPAATDGVYTIDTDGLAGALDAIDVFCDMTTDGGGWTLVLRTTSDGPANFALVTDYATLYGTDVGDPVLAEPIRVSAQHWQAIEAQGDLMSRHDLRKTNGSSCDPMRYALLGGTLSVSTPGGGQTVSFAYSGGDPHSVVNAQTSPALLVASDRGPLTYCNPVTMNYVPWFPAGLNNCGSNTPAMRRGTIPAGQPQPQISMYALGMGLDGYDHVAACGGDPLQTIVNATLYLENLHEYYLR